MKSTVLYYCRFIINHSERTESNPCICHMALLLNVFHFLQDGRLTFDPGSKVVKLPYVNYLRELGTTFLNAYTNSPICCPSRAGKSPTKREPLPF